MAKLGERQLLAFDFGTQSIGVAVGQELVGSASPLNAIKAKDGIPNWDDLASVFEQWLPDLVIVGLPLNMDGSEQELTLRARKFGNRIHGRFGLPIVWQDERLTTVDTKQRLFDKKGFRGLQKGAIDSGSACIILESWCREQST
ncbi:Holliday junction resolvase RuvX [Alginatibacterium sediminis]|uniref:Putative pre-16S rRNA nuclease n=1 Tax=Alginatibacterium sediminis TaxID=2164068 RepID=A0A420EDW7_9ALTE|nr:Holliday junction resolvase RuvX [Alginatibacterium sediminis]RKF18863.1 Holliday junction resolvase RuvX [Alginatibacterium sediminis]